MPESALLVPVVRSLIDNRTYPGTDEWTVREGPKPKGALPQGQLVVKFVRGGQLLWSVDHRKTFLLTPSQADEMARASGARWFPA